MGNYASTITNKNNNSVSNFKESNFKELNNNNSEFLSKLNEIATDYILGQNFINKPRGRIRYIYIKLIAI